MTNQVKSFRSMSQAYEGIVKKQNQQFIGEEMQATNITGVKPVGPSLIERKIDDILVTLKRLEAVINKTTNQASDLSQGVDTQQNLQNIQNLASGGVTNTSSYLPKQS